MDGTNQNGPLNEVYSTSFAPMVRLNFDPSLEVVDPTSVNDVFLSEFLVYPNPNNGEFNLEIETKNSTDIVVSISNTLGQEVYNESLQSVVTLTKSLNLSHLEKGIYNIILSDKIGRTQTQKIIIQ